MRDILIATLPLLGAVIGAYLHHRFASSNDQKHQADLRRQQAYADYLRAATALALSSNADRGSALVLLADAKARMAIYASPKVLHWLANFEKAGSVLSDETAADAFLRTVEYMRKDGDASGAVVRIVGPANRRPKLKSTAEWVLSGHRSRSTRPIRPNSRRSPSWPTAR